MHATSALARIARSQAINLRNLLRGWPLTYTGTSAMTLDADDLAVAESLLSDRRGWDDAGPVRQLEEEFRRWNGSGAAFAFVSARVALGAAVAALGLKAGDQVVVPGFTCVVVANALQHAGLEIVYADIELDTYGLDRDALKRAIGPRTRAVLLHHLFGLVCRDFDATLDLARSHGLRVIEDCAQATGAEFRGRRVGNYGDVAVYSGDPSKVFTCVQGGLVTTNDEELAAKLKDIERRAPFQTADIVANRLRNVRLNYILNKDPQRWWKADLVWLSEGNTYHRGIADAEVSGGRSPDEGHRMAPPIARLALNQLVKIDHYNARRRANAERWAKWCAAQGFAPPLVVPGSTPVFLRYPVLVPHAMKADLRWAYRGLGVVPGAWFVSHLHPAAIQLPGVPMATRAVEQCINLPTLFPQDSYQGPSRSASE